MLSWGVLLDDLETAYDAAREGREPRLRRAADAVPALGGTPGEPADDPDATGDLSYWLGLLAQPTDRLLVEAAPSRVSTATDSRSGATLDRSLTADILRTMPRHSAAAATRRSSRRC